MSEKSSYDSELDGSSYDPAATPTSLRGSSSGSRVEEVSFDTGAEMAFEAAQRLDPMRLEVLRGNFEKLEFRDREALNHLMLWLEIGAHHEAVDWILNRYLLESSDDLYWYLSRVALGVATEASLGQYPCDSVLMGYTENHQLMDVPVDAVARMLSLQPELLDYYGFERSPVSAYVDYVNEQVGDWRFRPEQGLCFSGNGDGMTIERVFYEWPSLGGKVRCAILQIFEMANRKMTGESGQVLSRPEFDAQAGERSQELEELAEYDLPPNMQLGGGRKE